MKEYFFAIGKKYSDKFVESIILFNIGAKEEFFAGIFDLLQSQ